MTDNESIIQDRMTKSNKARVAAFASKAPKAFKAPRAFCGHSYVTQPYGGGQRFHCPSCDVRRNAYGYMVVSWTNGRTYQRFCSN
jgi:hypothetical protein